MSQDMIKTIEVCTKLCVKDISSNKINIAQQSCLDRCQFKFKEAIDYTNSVLKFQNLDITKQQKIQEEIKKNQPDSFLSFINTKPPVKN
jgi:hypothetical protein